MGSERIQKFGGSTFALLLAIAADVLSVGGGPVTALAQTIAERPAVGFLLVAAVAVGIYTWRADLRRLLGSERASDAGKRFREWCLKARYTLRVESNPNADFQFTVTDFQHRTINVIKISGDPFFVLAIGLRTSAETQERLSQLDETQTDSILEELQLELARRGMRYSGLSRPLELVEIYRLVQLEISEYRFLEELQNMVNTHILYIILLHRGIRQMSLAKGLTLLPRPDTEAPPVQGVPHATSSASPET